MYSSGSLCLLWASGLFLFIVGLWSHIYALTWTGQPLWVSNKGTPAGHIVKDAHRPLIIHQPHCWFSLRAHWNCRLQTNCCFGMLRHQPASFLVSFDYALILIHLSSLPFFWRSMLDEKSMFPSNSEFHRLYWNLKFSEDIKWTLHNLCTRSHSVASNELRINVVILNM